MIKEPTRSVKAVLLPSWIAPSAVQRTARGRDVSNRAAQGKGRMEIEYKMGFRMEEGCCGEHQGLPHRMVAGTGQLRRSSTRENRPEKGVALSRANAHQIRPSYGCCQ